MLESLALVLGLVLSLGCGDNPLNRKAVSGQVVVNGQPLVTGSIGFVPVNNKTVVSGGAIVDGKYSLSVEQGLPPGEYAVNINAPDPNWKYSGKGEDLAPEWLPTDYSRDGKHKVTVKDSGSNVFDFEIEAKSKK